MQKEQLSKPSHEEHLFLLKGLPGRRRFCTGVAGRRNSDFDGRRYENVTDTRTPSGEADRGERTVAPCPLPVVQATIADTNNTLVVTWCAGSWPSMAR